MITLAALEGVWCLDREIDDRRAGLTGRFVGEAIWAPDGAGLTQTETGLLRYGTAPPMQATRRYIWREGHGGPEVFFADGRPFHQVTGTGAAHHDCPPDVYEVRYEVTDWPLWQSRWQVSGPRKDAVIISRYRRIP